MEEIRKLIENIKQDIQDSRKESKERGEKTQEDVQRLEKEIKNLSQTDTVIKHEFKRLERKIDVQGEEIKKIKDGTVEDKKIISEHSLEQASHLGLTMAEVSKQGGRVENIEDAVRAIVNELGIEDKVKVGSSMRPPGMPGAKVKGSRLAKLSRENKGGTIASVAAALLIILQIVWKLMEHQ